MLDGVVGRDLSWVVDVEAHSVVEWDSAADGIGTEVEGSFD